MTKLNYVRVRNKNPMADSAQGAAMGGAALLSLSLFLLLLAFFIVLNAVSSYEEQKVKETFQSLDRTFANGIIPTEDEKSSYDERELGEDGNGDSIEDIQGVLESILPGLDLSLTESPNGGDIMAIRMKKDKFERLSKQLMPVLVRILNIKDQGEGFDLQLVSYVRNTLTPSARQSYDVLEGYKSNIIDAGLDSKRILLSLEQGNPAYLMIQFEKGLLR